MPLKYETTLNLSPKHHGTTAPKKRGFRVEGASEKRSHKSTAPIPHHGSGRGGSQKELGKAAEARGKALT